MNETLNLTLSTNPAFILSIAGVVVFTTLAVVGSMIAHSVRELSTTIRRKDFKLKPEFNKSTGELVWEEPYNPWNFFR